jgi:PST family polysaccharide transporter
MQSSRSVPKPTAGGSRGWRFVLLAQPTVQAVRFLAKLVLAAFLFPEELGQPVLALLIVLGASLIAARGLDEGLVFADRLTRTSWRRLQRVHHTSGAAMSVLCALIGWVLTMTSDDPELGRMVMAFAPMVWLANTSVLPTALLVRERAFQRIFLMDVYAVLAFSITTVALAAAGAGAWSLVGGWYVNAVVTVLASRRFARPLQPVEEGDPDEAVPILRYGSHLTGAGLAAYLAEQLDSFLVGGVLGPAVLGVYALARHIAQWSENFFMSLAERGLFPELMIRQREERLHDTYEESLRAGFVFAVPLNVLLSFLAIPLITWLYKPIWEPVGPLLAVLALCAGARCIEMAPSTALKAAGRSRTVLVLSAIKLTLLIIVLPLCLEHGARAVALGMLGVRTAGALAALIAAGRSPELVGESRTRLPLAGALACLLWCAGFVPAARWLTVRLEQQASMLLVVLPLVALLLWGIARLLADRRALLRDWGFCRAKLSRGRKR